MGRDTSKQAKKKAASASSEYVSKIHDLYVQKIELFKETEGERKARLDEIVTLEKVKVEEAREHRKQMLDIEQERLALDKQRFHKEAEKKEKKEDERILAINLDQCLPIQRMYYKTLQEDIIQKLMSKNRGPTQWGSWWQIMLVCCVISQWGLCNLGSSKYNWIVLSCQTIYSRWIE